MSTSWLHVQSFFADADVLRAINDLSVDLKFRAAGIDNPEWKALGGEARKTLESFLGRVIELGAGETGGVILGVDPRTQSLVRALSHSEDEVSTGEPCAGPDCRPEVVLALLKGDAPPERLIPALRELRRVILAHQQQDADVLFQGR